jgi:hypothetical protein
MEHSPTWRTALPRAGQVDGPRQRIAKATSPKLGAGERHLQTPCCGEALWAYYDDFVRARLRERQRDPKYGWSNRSVASRLPQWMKAGKNREVVLKGLGRLRAQLEAVQHGAARDDPSPSARARM